MPEIDLDLSGLKCPLPALRTRKALSDLAPGDRLVVVCTDPLAGVDIPNAAREAGGRVERLERDGPALRFILRRDGSPAA